MRSYLLIISLLLLPYFFSCASEQPDEVQESISSTTDPTTAAIQGMENLHKENERPPMEATTLKAMLPESLNGLPKTSDKSNRVGAGNFVMTTATARYENEAKDVRYELIINDGIGKNAPGMNMMDLVSIDREEGGKTTRTISINGHKAVREYDSARQTGSLTVIYPQSTIVINGRGLSGVHDLEKAFNALNLKQL